MRPLSPSLSVIVPTLNEAENIEGIIAKILKGGASLEMEIIVVDDGSRDDTQAIVRRLAETLPVTLLARDKPKDGLAGAVLAGARAATAGVVLVIDADGSHPPEKIPEVALPVIRGEQDMVIGSRYAPGGSTPGWSRKRRLMSRAASAAAWPLTDVHDALSGYFAVRKDLMASIPSDAAGFKIALEILVRGGDSLRVGEVPIAFRDRELGESKMGSKVIFTYFRRLLALSGWRESQDTVRQAMVKTGIVWLLDFAIFAAAWWLHATLNTANIFAFAGGALLNAWLKSSQSPEATRRSVPFLTRLLFVSLLAFFLRGGVLGTCVSAFGLPWLAGVVPAIMTGWAVLFLGYALFIWPVRDQYGTGIRWRVASVGATAYLLALRAVYLYTLPLSARLAAAEPTGGNWLALEMRHLGTALLGSNSAGINLSAPVCWIIAACAVFQTAQRVFDKTTAFRALLLFSVLPVFFGPGSVFFPETLIVTAWAVAIWLLSFALRWEWRLGCIAGAAVTALFWWPHSLLPGAVLVNENPPAIRAALFIILQMALATPADLIALAPFCSRLSGGDRRAAATAAAVVAAVAEVAALLGYIHGTWSMAISGVIWLPLLPFIAADMQRNGHKPSRWLGSVICFWVVAYGCYFYLLAFN